MTNRGTCALIGALLALTISAPARAAEPPPPPPSRYVQVIGDSITKSAGPGYKQRYHPSADIEGVNGRKLTALSWRIRTRLAKGPSPRLWVLALGTVVGDPMPTRAEFVAAFDLIPRTSRVILVTPWVAPTQPETRVANLALVERWMKDVDRYRPNAAIASWAYTMRNVPGAAELYISEDGVHPTLAGEVKWADLIHDAESRF